MASRRSAAFAFAAGILAAALPGAARAQGTLTVYCSVQEEWCRPMMAAFERATGIRVAMTQPGYKVRARNGYVANRRGGSRQP